MNVTLIIPPSIFLLDERVFPSLGILRVAASLESAGHCVDVLDLSGISNFREVVEIYCSTNKPTIVGITVTTPQLPAVEQIRRVLKDYGKCKVILGGPHVTLTSSAAKLERK